MNGLVVSWLLIIAVSLAGAVNPVVWGTENAVVLVGCLWLFLTRKSRPLSKAGYLSCTLFLIMHEVGAHYTYHRVPLGYWLQSVLGRPRNDYDRIVHFACGIMLTVVAWESFRRNFHGSVLAFYLWVFSLVMWLSALYEIVEAFAIMLAPGPGTIFMATQGDNFDSQNDMACAMLGCCLTLLGIAISRKRA
jgi:putative membrane protein